MTTDKKSYQTTIAKEYLAGIADCVGTITVENVNVGGKETYRPTFTISSTNKLLPETMYLEFGGSFFSYEPKGKKVIYKWVVKDMSARDVLKDLFPYMLIRRTIVQIILENTNIEAWRLLNNVGDFN